MKNHMKELAEICLKIKRTILIEKGKITLVEAELIENMKKEMVTSLVFDTVKVTLTPEKETTTESYKYAIENFSVEEKSLYGEIITTKVEEFVPNLEKIRKAFIPESIVKTRKASLTITAIKKGE